MRVNFGSARPMRRAVEQRRRKVALLAVAAALAPGFAFAQTADKPLTIGVEGTAAFDTNPAQGSQQLETLRRLEGNEWILSPAATIAYAHQAGRNRFILQGRAGYDFHQKNKSLDRERIDTTLDYAHSVGSLCSVGVTASYARAQSQLQDLTLTVTENAEQTVRGAVSQTCGTPGGLTQSLSVNHLMQTNSDGSLSDFDTTGISGGLGYASRTVGNVAIMANHTVTNYDSPSRPNAPGLRQDDLKLDGIGLQIDRPIGARLSGSAGVFYSRASGGTLRLSPTAPEDEFSGITASANLTYRMGPRLRLAAQAGRNVGGTSRPDEGYVVTTSGQLSADYTMSTRVSAGIGGQWNKDDYRGGDPILPSIGPDSLKTTTGYANVTVRLGRNSSLAASVRHQRGRADPALFDYTTTRFSLTLSAQF